MTNAEAELKADADAPMLLIVREVIFVVDAMVGDTMRCRCAENGSISMECVTRCCLLNRQSAFQLASLFIC